MLQNRAVPRAIVLIRHVDVASTHQYHLPTVWTATNRMNILLMHDHLSLHSYRRAFPGCCEHLAHTRKECDTQCILSNDHYDLHSARSHRVLGSDTNSKTTPTHHDIYDHKSLSMSRCVRVGLASASPQVPWDHQVCHRAAIIIETLKATCRYNLSYGSDEPFNIALYSSVKSTSL